MDVPSGLDPQTGETANIFTKCDMTVTFHKMKQGIPKRKDLTGELFAEKIGIPPEAEEGILWKYIKSKSETCRISPTLLKMKILVKQS